MLFCADANKKKEKRTAVFVSNQLLCGVRALVRVIALSDCLNNATAVSNADVFTISCSP